MLICLDCRRTFPELPDNHDYSDGCPWCGGYYDDAVICRYCDEILPKCETVRHPAGGRVCKECRKELEDERERSLL